MNVYRNPYFIPLTELAEYGDRHEDPLVQRMSTYLFMILTHMDYWDGESHNGENIADWLEYVDETVRGLRRELEMAEEDAQILRDELEKSERINKSLRYDLDKDMQGNQIAYLKSEIVTLTEDKKKLGAEIARLNGENTKLHRSLNTATEKLNTWSALSKEY